MVKGGAKNGSASYREGMAFDKRLSYVGFRCVLPVAEAAAPITPRRPCRATAGAVLPGTPATPAAGGPESAPGSAVLTRLNHEPMPYQRGHRVVGHPRRARLP